jgi:hypothetical protein
VNPNEAEVPSSAADDVGFSLEMLASFYADIRERTQEAIAFAGGDRDQIDVPNLAASIVPSYNDELMALGHLMAGRPLDPAAAQKLVYDAAFGLVIKELGGA